jgi:hypothetical protein
MWQNQIECQTGCATDFYCIGEFYCIGAKRSRRARAHQTNAAGESDIAQALCLEHMLQTQRPDASCQAMIWRDFGLQFGELNTLLGRM